MVGVGIWGGEIVSIAGLSAVMSRAHGISAVNHTARGWMTDACN